MNEAQPTGTTRDRNNPPHEESSSTQKGLQRRGSRDKQPGGQSTSLGGGQSRAEVDAVGRLGSLPHLQRVAHAQQRPPAATEAPARVARAEEGAVRCCVRAAP